MNQLRSGDRKIKKHTITQVQAAFEEWKIVCGKRLIIDPVNRS